MSVLKILLVLLAIGIILIVVFHINLIQNKPILLIFAGLLVILLIVAFFDIITELIGIAIGVLGFLFLLYLLLLVLRLLV